MNKRTIQTVVVGILAIACGLAYADPALAATILSHIRPEFGIAGAAASFALLGDTSLVEIKKLIDDQGTAWEEFKKTNDALIKAKAEGKAVADLEAKLVTIGTQMDSYSEFKAKVEAEFTKLNRPNLGDEKALEGITAETKAFNIQRKAFSQNSPEKDVTPEEYTSYKAAFWSYVRKGKLEALSEGERKSMLAGDDANGGYLLPAPTVGKVVQKVYELSPIRQIADVMQISGPVLEGLYDNDEGTAAYVGEVAARTNTNTPTLGKYRIEAYEIYANPKCSQTLIDDAAVDVEAWLVKKLANKFGRFEGSEFINGTGMPGKISGFAAAYTLVATADGTRTWGQIEKVKTTANGDFASSSPGDTLFDLTQAFKDAYLNNARWVTRREVIGKVRKFKEATTNAYMWQPGLAAGKPDTLLGYPIVNAQDIPTLATGSASMWFGDFSQAYQIIDRQGMRTLRDNLTDKPNVQFYTTARVGGAVLNFEAIKTITFEA